MHSYGKTSAYFSTQEHLPAVKASQLWGFHVSTILTSPHSMTLEHGVYSTGVPETGPHSVRPGTLPHELRFASNSQNPPVLVSQVLELHV